MQESKKKNKITVNNLSFWYQDQVVLNNINCQFAENTITAVVGPSGVGKSTFLSVINRLWESIPSSRIEGEITVKLNNAPINIYSAKLPSSELRKKVGTVFQTPNPLPMSIFKNIAFPLKLAGEKDKETIRTQVEIALKKAFLWDEVKNRLESSALELSGGQQQRLCIARALILNPEVLLLDEPTSSLDEKSGRIIEDLLLSLKKQCTLLLVSHYQEQVKRIADREISFSKSNNA